MNARMQEAKSVEEWIKEITGSCTVHPGHPLVIACAIIRTFESYKASVAKTNLGHAEAISDGRIPGTGDHVSDAMKMLLMGHSGASADEMVLFARNQWINGSAGGHIQKVAPGQEQADLVEPYFRAQVARWLSASK